MGESIGKHEFVKSTFFELYFGLKMYGTYIPNQKFHSIKISVLRV